MGWWRAPSFTEGMAALWLQSGTEQWCPPAPQLSGRQGRGPSVCCPSNCLLCIQPPTPSGPARMQISAGSALPELPPGLQRCHVPPSPVLATSLPGFRAAGADSEHKGRHGAATAGTGGGHSCTWPGTGALRKTRYRHPAHTRLRGCHCTFLPFRQPHAVLEPAAGSRDIPN